MVAASMTGGVRALGPVLLYRVAEPRRRRLRQLLLGLPVFGLALGISIEAALGVNPWTTFHQGLSLHTPLSIGAATIVTGLVLLTSFPLLREPLGVGTLCNVALVGIFVDLSLWIIPDLTSLPLRIVLLILSPMLIGLGSGLYIGAGLGPGPRDGLMTALERRGLPIWLARGIVEVSALTIGWILGGDVGVGTVWMATAVGPCVHVALSRLRIDEGPHALSASEPPR